MNLNGDTTPENEFNIPSVIFRPSRGVMIKGVILFCRHLGIPVKRRRRLPLEGKVPALRDADWRNGRLPSTNVPAQELRSNAGAAPYLSRRRIRRRSLPGEYRPIP